jgi:hypothetical protein
LNAPAFGGRVCVSALPTAIATRFLSRVFEPTIPKPSRVRAPAGRAAIALAGAGIIAATLLGMLLGLGRRYSTLWRPLNAAAHTVIGTRADGVWGFQADVTLVGGAVVLVMSAMAGVVFAELTSSGRTLHRAIVALGSALVGYLVHVHIVARSPGGLAALLTLGELRALYAAVAFALLAGMRYAFPPDAGVSREY